MSTLITNSNYYPDSILNILCFFSTNLFTENVHLLFQINPDKFIFFIQKQWQDKKKKFKGFESWETEIKRTMSLLAKKEKIKKKLQKYISLENIKNESRCCHFSSCKENNIKKQNQMNKKLVTQQYFPEMQKI